MKNFKRIVALATVLSVVMLSSVISAFALGTMTVTPSATTAIAGDIITIKVDMSSLVDAKGTTASVQFDNAGFGIDKSNNTNYNFGNAFAASYYPKYINNAFTGRAHSAKNGGMDLPLTLWQNVSYNATENEVLVLLADTASNTVITGDYEAIMAGPYCVAHFDFVAKDDITAGTYDFVVKLDVSTTSGLKTFTETVTVTVGGGSQPAEEFVVAEETVAGAKVAFFAKNVTNEAFAAGTYGINFGGVNFAAGVDKEKDAVECKAGETFVVAFEDPDGDLKAGTYTFYAYYNNGANKSNEDTVTID